MKILHLFSNWKWTGPAEPAINLCWKLHERGYDTELAVGRGPRVLPNAVRAAAVERGLPLLDGLRLRKHLSPVANALDILRLGRLMDERRWDIVHVHTINDHRIAAQARRLSRVKPLLVRSFYDDADRPISRAACRLLRRHADALIVYSDAVRALVTERIFTREPARVLKVEGAVDLQRFNPERTGLPDMRGRLGLPEDAYLVGIVARVQPHRRFDLFLEAVRRAASVLPQLRAVIVGRGTRIEEVAKGPVRRSGLDSIVTFPGYLSGDDYVGMLKALDVKVFLMPGSDGTCRAVREALAMGVPVVAARRGMLPEIVRDGVNGLLVGYDAEELSGAIVRLGTDAELRRRLAAGALEDARSRFDLQRQAEAVATVYERLVGRRQGWASGWI